MGTPITVQQVQQFQGLLVQKKLELGVISGSFVQICRTCCTFWISRRVDFGRITSQLCEVLPSPVSLGKTCDAAKNYQKMNFVA